MDEIAVKIVANGVELPSYKTSGAAGIDLSSAIDNIIKPGERLLVPTGLFMEIPEGYEAQVRPRSGLAINHGIGVLNSPGTIDSDYRGEICVILFNTSNKNFEIKKGDRIAQIVFARVSKAEFVVVKELGSSERGSGGFGSTGR